MSLLRSPLAHYLDRVGVAASLLCAVHCALMPLLLGFLPLFGLKFLADETTEWMFFASAFIIGALSLLPSYARRHSRIGPLLFFTIGVGIILVARLTFGESRFEMPAAVAGASLIATAHLINHRLCRTCLNCRH
ncbi:MAG: MerC domain-containing protein [Acidobacteriota bacterium]|nr:MerC domain-containing protein [Acidobacteriota bacterium]